MKKQVESQANTECRLSKSQDQKSHFIIYLVFLLLFIVFFCLFVVLGPGNAREKPEKNKKTSYDGRRKTLALVLLLLLHSFLFTIYKEIKYNNKSPKRNLNLNSTCQTYNLSHVFQFAYNFIFINSLVSLLHRLLY